MQTIKNPLEIASIVRDKTFYINSHLSKFNINNGDYPLMTYDMANYTRYEFCLINEAKKAAVSNVPLREMWKLERMTDFLYQKDLEARFSKNTAETTLSPAYTVQISSGRMKGMTAAQVLLEAQDANTAINDLRNQYKWLKNNLQKYPKNQAQMDAIASAVKLFEAGQLNADSVKKTNQVVLYDAQMRSLRSRRVPDHLKAQNPNMAFVYDTSIVWNLGADNPITITINNYYAPVIVLPDKRLNVQRSNADKGTFLKVTMNLSADEWADIIRLIKMDMARFEMLNARESYDTAMSIDNQRRSAYTQAPQPQVQKQYNAVPNNVAPPQNQYSNFTQYAG